ncbi:Oidioi.mRNA.OKI2018_I69.chr1.g2837.t1.cds [Oikopleura dioica]|uniref:Oidioi.mRNA.OKI2018_I69.chr1.g2837.t1.cds n=1 Tax=Oikopleura dioica TaxID=34765 RepID=A0ABN7SZ73_OIKDI|nr:Oidioi.mRNA.OKI2018_I69.chr1.g2837.t1.cds [Oikopleura dioica]
MVLGLITRGVAKRAFCTKTLNYYDALGVDEDAPRDEIRRAYRKLVFQTHPDRHPGDESKEAQFKIVTEAFTVLSHPQKRAEYDQRILIRSEGSVVYSSMKWHRSESYQSPYNQHRNSQEETVLDELDALFANLSRQRSNPQKNSKVLDMFENGF